MSQQVFKYSLAIAAVTLVSILCSYMEPHGESNMGSKFEQWANGHGRIYRSHQERAYRMEVFLSNSRRVESHNKQAELGRYKYFLALNQLADITTQQYKQMYGHFGSPSGQGLRANITTKCTGSIFDTPNPPTQVSWVDKAVDKNVKNQGKCAANWAFSAVAAIQGLYALKMEKQVKFSDQQIIDCSQDYGNEGCGGGFMEQAYWYMVDHGLATEKSYPYTGNGSQKCTYSQSQRVAKVGKCARVPSSNYDKLISAVAQQPVSVSVASENFMLYDRGIFDGDCNTDLDRGLLLVGYGAEEEQEFWLLKNFLGVAWGEKGYIRLKRTPEDGPGMCGIQLAASVPQDVQ